MRFYFTRLNLKGTLERNENRQQQVWGGGMVLGKKFQGQIVPGNCGGKAALVTYSAFLKNNNN